MGNHLRPIYPTFDGSVEYSDRQKKKKITDIMHTITREIAFFRRRYGDDFPRMMRLSSTDPWEFGRYLRQEGGYDEQIGQHVKFLGALTALWWKSGRVIWTVTAETCEEVSRTGINFIPETPPDSWNRGCIIVEGKGGAPLFGDVVSIGAFCTVDATALRSSYWILYFLSDGRCSFFSLDTRQPRLNASARKRHALALEASDAPDLDGQVRPSSPEERSHSLRILEWLFTFSFYALEPTVPGWEVIPAGDGPVERNAKGKPIKRDGRPIPMWTYRDARPKPEILSETDASMQRARLDTSGLSLAGVVVKQHWRRFQNGKIRLIKPYPSHRWKREDQLGVKTTI